MPPFFRKLNSIYLPGAKVSRFLATLAFSGVAYGLYRGVLENYLAEAALFPPFERGIVEFFRELPGFLVVFILAWMYRMSENKIFKIGLFVMTLGIAGLLISGTGKVIVVAFIVLASFGEHIILPLKSTITLSFARKETGGAALGVTSAVGQFGNIAGYAVASLIFFMFTRAGFAREDAARFKAVFLFSAALMAVSVVIALAIKESPVKIRRRRLYFAKKFGKYYMLEVFYGARKQVFLTFAPYVIILQYGADASIISLLFAVSAGVCVIFSPVTGRIIDKLGYKFIMVTDTLLLVAVCFFYGFSHRIFSPHTAYIVVCVNYALDAVVSLASMASNVYVKDIAANQEEITATLYTGVSVNHAISIFIALMGGWIWKVTGIEVLFSISAFLGLLNSLYAATIPSPKKRRKARGPAVDS
ncbi:MAG: MFS transporter [Spirochaetaceae bacterium]|jgi:MFS family permease|nr:MFS transporter [Spirochaetaceae bacterium]